MLNYMDSDPGAGVSDFTCGPRSYDGHKGTDFALLSFDAMEAGVPVHPSAPGIVTAFRDGMPDTGLDDTPADVLEGRDCGNGVVIDHGDGWETQYCHLKQGSLTVERDQEVRLTDPLGLVGFSGRTQFPHVHVTLRHNGQVVDPSNTDTATCDPSDTTDDDLWAEPIAYDPGGLVAAGMAMAIPDYAELKQGGYRDETLPSAPPALVGWALIYGAREGDLVTINIVFPDGTPFTNKQTRLTRTQAMVMRAHGRKAPPGGWPSGDYRLTTHVTRRAEVIDQITRVIRVGG